MHDTYHVAIVSPRHGRGHLTFFDEPFGEQTPFEWAGGFCAAYESGFVEGGVLVDADLALGLEKWLVRNHWRILEDQDSIVEV